MLRSRFHQNHTQIRKIISCTCRRSFLITKIKDNHKEISQKYISKRSHNSQRLTNGNVSESYDVPVLTSQLYSRRVVKLDSIPAPREYSISIELSLQSSFLNLWTTE